MRRRFQIQEQVQAQSRMGVSWVVSGCQREEGGGAVGPTTDLGRDFPLGKID